MTDKLSNEILGAASGCVTDDCSVTTSVLYEWADAVAMLERTLERVKRDRDNWKTTYPRMVSGYEKRLDVMKLACVEMNTKALIAEHLAKVSETAAHIDARLDRISEKLERIMRDDDDEIERGG
jgi:oligoribonuclease NrnB/cAMP/cGMP phosphodiesterase (DHH superfamily)